MTTAVLLDHVSAYATAVRSHLSDLSPEQVEDLTDGLEADLAEALEDPRGAVATGEIALGGAVVARSSADDPSGASLIDLTRRFGPAAEYAAELRRAAGVAEPLPVRPGDLGPVAVVTGLVRDARVRFGQVTGVLRGQVWWPVVAALVLSVRPAWWLLRGWIWFSLCMGFMRYGLQLGQSNLERFVPLTPLAWLILVGAVVLSLAVGQGLGRSARWTRALALAAGLAALLATVPLLTGFAQEVQRRVFVAGQPEVVYIEVPSTTQPVVEDGVRVDGQLVSNLFVYDAAGNPLTGVQVFDDRGRPVRTTYDDGLQQWSLPGVTEPWFFSPSYDADGRARWNVYPLQGAPATDWLVDDEVTLAEDAELRTPPAPFAKAPAVTATSDASGTTTAP